MTATALSRFQLCLSTLLIASTFGSSAYAQTIYGSSYAGADGMTTLVTVDAATGAATPVGAVGFERCGGIDFDAAGTLFATCERADGSDTPVLVTIDLMTGAGTEIGPTGLNDSIGDISFRSDGVLFAFDVANDPEHTLATLDPLTGAGTVVGDSGLSAAGGNAMGFDLADTLFHSQLTTGPGQDLNTLDQTTGMATFVSLISPATDRFNAMDMDPATGTMYATLNEGTGGGGPRSLATIDTVAATVAVIGVSDPSLDGIAVQPVLAPPPPLPMGIPTLGGLGFVALILLLAGAGVLLMARRRTA